MSNKNNLPTAQQKINQITIWGMIVNIALTIIKTIGGVIIHSVSLVADGIHSLSDLLTDVIVLVSTRAAKRPPDSNHQFGHGKFETVGSQLIGIALLLVGGGIGWTALSSLYQHKQNFPGPLIVVFAVLSIVAKEILFQYTQKVARKYHSSSLYANAWHHRSDALSSVAVLVGGVSSLFGFGYGDHIAGLIVGIMIIWVAGKIIFEGYKELSEHAIDENLIKVVKEILEDNDEVVQWHKLRTRKIGSELFIDVHILVLPELSVQKSHELTIELEQSIQKNIDQPINALIHVEPFFETE